MYQIPSTFFDLLHLAMPEIQTFTLESSMKLVNSLYASVLEISLFYFQRFQISTSMWNQIKEARKPHFFCNNSIKLSHALCNHFHFALCNNAIKLALWTFEDKIFFPVCYSLYYSTYHPVDDISYCQSYCFTVLISIKVN